MTGSGSLLATGVDSSFGNDAFPKPQTSFLNPPDNSELPFVPTISSKPHSIEELSEEITAAQKDPQAFFYGKNLAEFSFDNPYSPEILALDLEDISRRLLGFTQDPPKLQRLVETKFLFVNNIETFEVLFEDLSQSDYFCVDLEDNSERSYLGINCLIQISTRTCDYVVDTLEPKVRASIPSLLKIFTNPKVLKIFHGADSDIRWLQRDFGLYVVNLFDTGQAARVLKYPSFSLAYLLGKFCNCTPDKSLQRADWRVRPLTEELLKYAREDTHYLAYIFGQIIKDLVVKANESGSIETSLIKEVLEKSSKVSLKTYEKPFLARDPSFQDIMNRNRHILSPKKLEALRLLFGWRDKTARELDEGSFYICRDQALFKVVEAFPLSINQLDAIRGLPAIFRFRGAEVIQVFKTVQQRHTESAIGPKPQPIHAEVTPRIKEKENPGLEILASIKLPKLEINEKAKTCFFEETKFRHNSMFFFEKLIETHAKPKIQIEGFNNVIDLLSFEYPDFAQEFQEAALSMSKLGLEENSQSEEESDESEDKPNKDSKQRKKGKKNKIKQAETMDSPNHAAEFLEFPKTKGPAPPPKPSKEVKLPREMPNDSLLTTRTVAERSTDKAPKTEKGPNLFDSITAEFDRREEEQKMNEQNPKKAFDLNQKLSDLSIENPFHVKSGKRSKGKNKQNDKKKSSKYGTRIKDKMFFG